MCWIASSATALVNRPERDMRARAHPTRLVLLGHPVIQSLSPVFQNAALAHVGLALRYEALDVTSADLAVTLQSLGADGAAGNITIPHKEAVAARARCTPLATQVGAVNTFWFEHGVLCGDNTDVAGVSAAIRALCPGGIAHARCAVLGAGGSAAAVLVALEQLGCRDIVVSARTPERARRLAGRVAVPIRIVDSAEDAVQEASLVINATPVGLRDDAMPVPPSALAPHAAALDLVYRHGETAWVRACREADHMAEDGLRLLLEQGASAFECWFGQVAPRAVMWQALAAAGGRPT